jgi:hypothetical protein
LLEGTNFQDHGLPLSLYISWWDRWFPDTFSHLFHSPPEAALKQHRDVQQARQRLRILDTETLPGSECQSGNGGLDGVLEKWKSLENHEIK